MKYGVIAGPYVPNYPEVTDKLALVKSFAARWVYNVLVTKFQIEEDWGDDAIWVSGIVGATKTDIAHQSGVGRSGFNRLWSQLVEAGLISEREDTLFVIHFYKKKAYDSISAMEVRERLSKLEAILEKNPELNDQKVCNVPQIEADPPQIEADVPQIEDTLILLKVFKKQNSLSREKIISWFYTEIGQSRISGSEREKARKSYRNLRKDGFSVREIAFAAEWTIANAKEKPRTFGLISNTIGQAMEALEKAEEKAKRVEEERRLVAEAKADQESQAEDRVRIEAIKDGMTPRKRENLREEAFRALKDTPGITERFIGEPLIKAKESDIIRKSLEEKQP